MDQTEAVLHDGTTIDVYGEGHGDAILLAVRAQPHDESAAAVLRQWGGDPDLGPSLIRGLASGHRVIAADYEGHRMAHPAPDTLTAGTLTADLLAIADAAQVDRFAYYGYSWLALAGLQLAIRADRLRALAMGGFPPVEGPYEAMLQVTRATHAAAVRRPDQAEVSSADVDPTPGDWESVEVQSTEAQTRQFVTLYESLLGFDDDAAQRGLTIPRLCFAGAEDNIDYGSGWGEVRVAIADPLEVNEVELRDAGWQVVLLPGLDHMSAMHGEVILPILLDWLGVDLR
jgi:pimeloyl-ACP methyl ester carboxylesterase